MKHKIRAFALCCVTVLGSHSTVCEAVEADIFRDHLTYPGLEPDWWISSQSLVVENAVTDAKVQSDAVNCRMIAYQGRSYIIPAGEEENFEPEMATFGLMIVRESRHGGDAAASAANTLARAYGGPYNQTIKHLCGL